MNNNIEILELLYRYKTEIDDIILTRLKLNRAKLENIERSCTWPCAICYKLYDEFDRTYDCDDCMAIFDEIDKNPENYDGPYSCECCMSNLCRDCFDCKVDYRSVLENIFELINEIDDSKIDEYIKKLNPENKFIDMDNYTYAADIDNLYLD
jgi:hypothetical protein